MGGLELQSSEDCNSTSFGRGGCDDLSENSFVAPSPYGLFAFGGGCCSSLFRFFFCFFFCFLFLSS